MGSCCEKKKRRKTYQKIKNKKIYYIIGTEDGLFSFVTGHHMYIMEFNNGSILASYVKFNVKKHGDILSYLKFSRVVDTNNGCFDLYTQNLPKSITPRQMYACEGMVAEVAKMIKNGTKRKIFPNDYEFEHK